MTKREDKAELIDVKELLQRDEDFLRAALQALAQAALGIWPSLASAKSRAATLYTVPIAV